MYYYIHVMAILSPEISAAISRCNRFGLRKPPSTNNILMGCPSNCQPSSGKRTICAHFAHKNMGSIPQNETQMLVLSGIFEIGSGQKNMSYIGLHFGTRKSNFQHCRTVLYRKCIGWWLQPLQHGN